MPIKSGKKMLEAIDAKNARVIVLTTLEGDTDREDSLALGADLFLVKAETPPNILIETIKELTKA
jgi:DNA-binding NarL/FixJ family response regulator